ncbi:MAG: EamA family transporter [Candidatus Dormibacteria bacterium]
MGPLLSLIAAVAYGTSDFAAGVGSRRMPSATVAVVAQSCSLVAAVAAVTLFPGGGPTVPALMWGALSGVGSAIGALCLYRGLAIGRMGVVATASALLTAVIPAGFGFLLGERLPLLAELGVLAAVAAIVLVSWRPPSAIHDGGRTGVLYGILAGLGFAAFFIALDRAGTHSGAWPLLPGQAVAVILEAFFASAAQLSFGHNGHNFRALVAAVGAGVLGGVANISFLAATGRGQLAMVAVITSLYPGVTIVLARLLLSERWTRVQAVGLVGAVAAIAMISAR